MSARRRMSIALATGVAVLAGLPAGAAAQSDNCARLAPFTPGAFSDPATIDSGFLPLTPGSQLVMEGQANRGSGAAPHRVSFTVTDLTKVVGACAGALGAALENLARTLSVEWARYGIRTTAVLPGDGASDEELATLVAYLASPAGDYFSGCAFTPGAGPA